MGKRFFCGAIFCLLAWAALAQPGPPTSAPNQAGGEKRDTVRIFIVHKMRESLNLSDAQTLKILDAMEAMDKEQEALKATRRASLEGLQAMVDDPKTSDAALKEAVVQFQRVQEQSAAKLRELDDRLLAVMTPRQQAQYILLRRQWLEEARQDISRPRGRRMGRNNQ